MIAPLLSMYRLILAEFRLRFYSILGLSFLVALLETFGVASVMPLIAAMVDPAGLSKNRVVAQLLALVGYQGAVLPVYLIGSITIALFIFANAASLVLSWWSLRFSGQLSVALSEKFAHSHFRRPFAFFMANTPADLANQLCNETAKVALGGVLQLCSIFVKVIQLALVLGLLLLISPVFSAVFFLGMAAIYALIYRHSSERIGAAGAHAAESSGLAVQAASEMYSMAREILLRGDCGYFVERVRVHLQAYYKADVASRFLPSLPKYALEVSAVCAIFALPVYRSIMGQDIAAEVPTLATFAYAGFRLMPTIQQLYASLTIIKFYEPLAKRLEDTFAAPADQDSPADGLRAMPAALEFKSVSYRYPRRGAAAVSRVSFSIARGERLALVGASGAGKSTVMDLVLGLLMPSDGAIIVDGAPRIAGGLSWATGVVGYVPQSPLILHDTIARNIAFGLEQNHIDEARCRQAAREAGFADLVDSHPAGLNAVIGGDILNFSGGERQRLAIARALYSKPAFLVLDEPGSALDPPTARKIFEMLCAPALDATVLVITHDLTYLPYFDKVVFMQDGKVVMAGSYDALVRDCPAFREFQSDLLRQQPLATAAR